MYTKDIERLVRTLIRQKTDVAYIRHYLLEEYRLTDALIDEVFTTCGVGEEKKQSIVKKTQEMMGGKKVDPKKPGDNKIKRTGFY